MVVAGPVERAAEVDVVPAVDVVLAVDVVPVADHLDPENHLARTMFATNAGVSFFSTSSFFHRHSVG